MEHPTVVQLTNRLGIGTGVGGVAACLARELTAKGVCVENVTLDSLHLGKPVPLLAKISPELAVTYRVIAYTFVGSVVAWLKGRRPGVVTISHNDSLVSDIYVNHGLLRPLVFNDAGRRRFRAFLRPLNVFLLVREWLRYRLECHHAIVNFSLSGEREHEANVSLGRARRVIIPNGVDLSRFRPDEERRRVMRAKWDVEGRHVALMVVNEFERKGVAIAAAAVAASGIKDLTLIVVGGTDREISHLVKRLGDDARHCMFVGRQTDNLPDFYRAADVYLLPSIQEAWPLVVLEAMASGVPCIATPVSSVPDIITDGVDGLIVARSADDFARALRRLLTGPSKRAEFGRRAQASAARYGWDEIASSYLSLLKDVLEAKSS